MPPKMLPKQPNKAMLPMKQPLKEPKKQPKKRLVRQKVSTKTSNKMLPAPQKRLKPRLTNNNLSKCEMMWTVLMPPALHLMLKGKKLGTVPTKQKPQPKQYLKQALKKKLPRKEKKRWNPPLMLTKKQMFTTHHRQKMWTVPRERLKKQLEWTQTFPRRKWRRLTTN